MFGLSVEHLLILLVAGLFILGPERLPESARWLAQTVRKIRAFAAGAQQQLEAELGPEFTQLRKPLQDLQTLRALDPKAVVGRYLLDDTFGEPPPPSAAAAPARLQPGERPPVDPDAT
ncbi:twin-arginine translocase TatA/TatE family subunit [Amycolatopsis mediterranei]|uniref:twin-arginine translocase TatA/TatE family subunit n=1 Tax=Amycolatopsis mediterranei TaxID=33910 RepID=UPI00341A5179